MSEESKTRTEQKMSKGMPKKQPDIKELFYEADTRKHQQLVAERLITCAKRLLDKAVEHDASKFSDTEKKHYIEPVWELNTKDVEFGSDDYKRLTAMMGDGWAHHCFHNSHHPENVQLTMPEFSGDPFSGMDLFDLMEMLCDWIAASKRRGNSPHLAFAQMEEKFGLSHQTRCILGNTLGLLERLGNDR